MMDFQQPQQNIPPPPTDAPLSHEWFRFRLEELIRRCDATVNHIVHGGANNNNRNNDYYYNDNEEDGDFSLPSTDELIGLPPSSRGTNAYARATKSLKDRLVREIRIMENTVENGFGTLASTEKSLSIAKKEVRELRSILSQYSPSRQNSPGQTPRNQNNNNNNSSVSASGSFSNNLQSSPSSAALQAVSSQPMYPADVAVNLSEEQKELGQLRELLKSVESQKLAAKKALQAEKAAFKDTCDTAVKCNSINGAQTLGR